MNRKLIKMIIAVIVISMIAGGFLFHVLKIGCPFVYFGGIPCMGCGMTRACWSLLHMEWLAAWQYHPLCYALPFMVLVLILVKWKWPDYYERTLFVCLLLFVVVYFIRLLNPADEIVKFHVQDGKIYQLWHIFMNEIID